MGHRNTPSVSERSEKVCSWQQDDLHRAQKRERESRYSELHFMHASNCSFSLQMMPYCTCNYDNYCDSCFRFNFIFTRSDKKIMIAIGLVCIHDIIIIMVGKISLCLDLLT